MADSNLHIVKNAMLSIGVIDIRRTPTAHDADVCLARMSSLIRALPGWMQWNDVEINQDYTAGDDERITVIGDVSVTVTLPQLSYVEPEIYFDTNGLTIKTGVYFQAPRDGARVSVAAQQGADKACYAYRSDTAKWTQYDNLQLTGNVPLEEAMHHHFETLLAVNIAPLYGAQVSGELSALYAEAKTAMAVRYSDRFRTRSPVDDERDAGLYY